MNTMTTAPPTGPGWGFYLLALLLILTLGALCAAVVLLLRERAKAEELARTVSESESRLDTLRCQDPVTGSLNREAFERILGAATARADRTGQPLCVVMLGLDSFRGINDRFDMSVGDQVLRRVRERLDECQPGAPLARLGGDEFAMILQMDIEASRSMCARLLQSVQRPIVCQGHECSISASLGLVIYPDHGSAPLLLANAGAAMRSVKRAGGGAHAEYEPSMGSTLRLNAELTQDLRRAVESRQLQLVYQPKVDARTLQVTAAEALLRWHHPTRGLVSPEIFIPLAERHGLMESIGQWVLEEACRQAAQWRAEGLRMRVAINISGVQLRQDDLGQRLQTELSRHGLRPARFTVEITETAAMENTDATRRALARLQQLGVHMSIDDFGVGVSSLAALRRLRFDELKIDREFMSEIETRGDARSIVQAIVQMAQALDMRVVAEGVETPVQRDLLVSMGCDELQGYLFARPMTASALSVWAARSNPAKESHPQFRASLFDETQSAPLDP
jgi:diguanylate cyclase (GGDEF)-like protein